jgi:hypothetical protein
VVVVAEVLPNKDGREDGAVVAAGAPNKEPPDGAEVVAAGAPNKEPPDGAEVVAAGAPNSAPPDGAEVVAAGAAPNNEPPDGAEVVAAAVGAAPNNEPPDGAEVVAAGAAPNNEPPAAAEAGAGVPSIDGPEAAVEAGVAPNRADVACVGAAVPAEEAGAPKPPNIGGAVVFAAGTVESAVFVEPPNRPLVAGAAVEGAGAVDVAAPKGLLATDVVCPAACPKSALAVVPLELAAGPPKRAVCGRAPNRPPAGAAAGALPDPPAVVAGVVEPNSGRGADDAVPPKGFDGCVDGVVLPKRGLEGPPEVAPGRLREGVPDEPL